LRENSGNQQGKGRNPTLHREESQKDNLETITKQIATSTSASWEEARQPYTAWGKGKVSKKVSVAPIIAANLQS
jgi:hypothetical protein